MSNTLLIREKKSSIIFEEYKDGLFLTVYNNGNYFSLKLNQDEVLKLRNLAEHSLRKGE